MTFQEQEQKMQRPWGLSKLTGTENFDSLQLWMRTPKERGLQRLDLRSLECQERECVASTL